MSLTPGTRLGAYEIVAPIGEGGMGVVYRARDVRLNRDVAIKILPDYAVSDANAVARFRFEAQAASALNHPHILTIYDIGETEEAPPRRYIAMEYISGDTLRARIGPEHDVGESVDLLIQIGEGLAKAHEAEIVHRDLKPDNIMITRDGYAKILDFGLAKLTDAGHVDSDETTPVIPTTVPGALVGTPNYMSPEQLHGAEVGPRSDIFSFGSVAYETLSGRRAFGGAMLAETVHQITAVDPPPLRSVDERIPPELQRVVSRCLAKKPAARFPTMREVVAELKRVRERMRETVRRFPRLVQLTFARTIEQFPARSPDGRQLVFAREIGRVRKLILSEPAESSERQLTRGDFDDIQPTWSPDGRALLFVRATSAGTRFDTSDVFGRYVDGDIWLLDPESGRESRLIEDAFYPAWSPDGTRIAFDASWSGPRRIWIADARGRNAQQLTTDDSEATSHVRPRWSPDGTKIVFQNIEGTKSDVRIVDVQTRATKWITDDFVMDVHPVWSFDGGTIYFSSYRTGGINVWSIPVDFDGTPAGAMQQITAGAGHDVDLDVPRSADRLVFAILKQNAELWRLPVDPQTGEATGVPEQVVAGARESSRGAWSPDGEHIAFGSDRGGEMNLWLLSLRDGRTRRLTSGAGGDYQPNWSPDAQSLVFFSGRANAIDIWRYDFDGEVLTRLTRGAAININPFFSPDGRHVAFLSDRDGRLEVFVMNANGSGVRQLTTCGVTGHFLRWTHDGARIFFRCPSARTTMTIALDGGEPEPTAEVIGGAHMSLSPDQSLMMDVLGHRTLWCSPLQGGAPRKVFEFDDAESRIDYPVWSPDGRWILFDRFQPQGGDVWAVEE
ncbi:MAG TPA: protein kinase [Thermoanaerobaculia bacterium]|jgi:Tol biopolymer transport system component|nr:protein kinase [Thermoanaerobaculia bacterium]